MSELRKLKITEMNRLTVEEFKEVDKLPLVVVLDEVRSLHNIVASRWVAVMTAMTLNIAALGSCQTSYNTPAHAAHKAA